MSKRQQAPGDLEHVRAFINTLDKEEGTEELEDPRALTAWLASRRLADATVEADEADLQHALELREALRAILLANNSAVDAPPEAAQTLDLAAGRAQLALRFSDDAEGHLVAHAGGVDGALGRLLAFVHDARGRGTWQRLKA